METQGIIIIIIISYVTFLIEVAPPSSPSSPSPLLPDPYPDLEIIQTYV